MRITPLRAAIFGLIVGCLHGAPLRAQIEGPQDGARVQAEQICRESVNWHEVLTEMRVGERESNAAWKRWSLVVEKTMDRYGVPSSRRPVVRGACEVYLTGVQDAIDDVSAMQKGFPTAADNPGS